MLEIQKLNKKENVTRIGEFLTSENAFEQTWAPNERALVLTAVEDSLQNENHQYWFIEDNGEVVGAMGVRENKYGSGGFEMDADYFAVHKNYRGQGLATRLLLEVEKYVEEKSGRYIHALSCDIESYAPARAFYQKNGYEKVAEIPNYYVEGEGRVDFFKEL